MLVVTQSTCVVERKSEVNVCWYCVSFTCLWTHTHAHARTHRQAD